MLINQVLIYSENHHIKNPKGIVIITHGIALHSIYYRKMAELLNQSGFSVVLYDVRGHGKSQGKRGDIKNIYQFISDLFEVVTHVRKDTDLPIYLLGHSMGGIITKLYATMYDNFDGTIIMSSPTSAQRLGILGLLPNFLFGNYKIKTDFSDPRLSHFPPSENVDPYALKQFTFRLIIQTLKLGTKYIGNNISSYKKPVLVLHGSEDKLVHPDMSKAFFNSVPHEQKTLSIIEGGYHNLNDDTVTEKTVEEIVDWLNSLVLLNSNA